MVKETRTREAAVAGRFYPGDADTLRRVVASLTGDLTAPKISATGIVVPHAGYAYSGKTVGSVISCIQPARRFVLLGPNHTGEGAALALAPEGKWCTPLGTVEVDGEMNRTLLALDPDLAEDARAHNREHSVEVQLPFLQLLQPGFTFSAICVGTSDYPALEALGHVLARMVRSSSEPVLLVTSSDMTHYESADVARSLDTLAIDRMTAVDPRGLHRTVTERGITMCGFAPAVSMLVACRDLGAASGRLIHYTNSGEASGDYDQVVGYAGIVI